ncbi:MAG TPA: hypothetical protein DCR14_01860 [Acidimicrobiaceae bacterium]|nr:hypothetical protein [Acidimicrobiaceae bacterium]
MKRKREAATRAEQALLAVLPRSVEVRLGAADDGGDVIVNGRPLQVKWAGEGQLGDVRRVLAQHIPRPDIVVARVLSPGARAELAEAGIGWVDETGAAEIALDTIIVARSGKPTKREAPRRWTPSALAVAEAALCGVKPTASAMHDATGLSMGSCVNALRILADLELLDASADRGRNSARRVGDRDRLLSAYASAAAALAPDLQVEVGVTWRDLADGLRKTADRWQAEQVDFAVTGALAAEQLAPYLTTVTTAEVYVSVETVVGLEALAASAGFKPVAGGRLILRPFPTMSANRLATQIGGLRVAPWPRVYVDLLHGGVRGEDAAEHLKEVVGDR